MSTRYVLLLFFILSHVQGFWNGIIEPLRENILKKSIFAKCLSLLLLLDNSASNFANLCLSRDYYSELVNLRSTLSREAGDP